MPEILPWGIHVVDTIAPPGPSRRQLVRDCRGSSIDKSTHLTERRIDPRTADFSAFSVQEHEFEAVLVGISFRRVGRP